MADKLPSIKTVLATGKAGKSNGIAGLPSITDVLPGAKGKAAAAKRKPGGFLHAVEHVVGQTGKDLYDTAVHSPSGLYQVGKATAEASMGNPKPLEHIAVATGKGFVQDFKHPLRHPGNTLLDIGSALSLGAGAAARVAEVGRLAEAGESAGEIGRAAVKGPRPVDRNIKYGDAEIPAGTYSRSALKRSSQRLYDKLQQRFPDTRLPLRDLHERVGHELGTDRRVVDAIGRAPAHALAKIRLSLPKQKALQVVAEGVPVDDRIRFHMEQLAGGVDAPVHVPSLDDLLANKTSRGDDAPSVERLQSYLRHVKGPPGISQEVGYYHGLEAHAPDQRLFVYRDEHGSPIGILNVSLKIPNHLHDALLESLKPADFTEAEGLHVAVDEAHRRKGIASALFAAAKDAGIDIRTATGETGYTEEGARFTHARLSREAQGTGGVRSPLKGKLAAATRKEIAALQASKQFVHDVHGMPRIRPDHPDLVEAYQKAHKVASKREAILGDTERLARAPHEEGSHVYRTQALSDAAKENRVAQPAAVIRAGLGQTHYGFNPDLVPELFRFPYASKKALPALGKMQGYKGGIGKTPGSLNHEFTGGLLKSGAFRNDTSKLVAESYLEAHRFHALMKHRDEFLQMAHDEKQHGDVAIRTDSLLNRQWPKVINDLSEKPVLSSEDAQALGHYYEDIRNHTFPTDATLSTIRSDHPAVLAEYRRLEKRVTAAEKRVESAHGPADTSNLHSSHWQDWSRARGYTESEISDFEKWLDLNKRLGIKEPDMVPTEEHPFGVSDAGVMEHSIASDEAMLAEGKHPDVKWIDERVLGGLNKPNPLVGFTGGSAKGLKVFDAINNGERAAILYLKPAYAVPNILGNAALNIVQQTWAAPVQVGRSARLWAKLDKDSRSVLRQAMGEGITGALHAQDGVAKGAINKMAELWSGPVDTPFRVNAFFYEARRFGYKTPAQIKTLLGDEKQLLKVAREANAEIIDYGRMGAFEQNVIRRVIFFYPWVKGSTVYAARFVSTHTTQAALAAQLGKQGAVRDAKDLGPLPSYAEGLFKVGDRHGDPLVMNPSSAGVLQTPADLLRSVQELADRHPGQAFQFAQNFTPAVAATLALLARQGVRTNESALSGAERQLVGNLPALVTAQQELHPPSDAARPRMYPRDRRDVLLHFLFGGLAPTPLDRAKAQRAKYSEDHPH